MKKSIFTMFFIMLTTVFTLSTATCFGQSFNSPEALKEYLDKQPANSPDKPIKATMVVNNQTIKNVADVIKQSSKYVSLTLSGNTLTTIPDNTFSNKRNPCESLVSITIPDSVTSIGDMAFLGCINLKSITIPNSVTSIRDSTFALCQSLTNITIPNSVISIDNQAFYLCHSLTSITIPNSVTSIERLAFSGCTSLTSVTFEDILSSRRLAENAFDSIGDLRDKYLAGGIGTYTRSNGKSETWTKQPGSGKESVSVGKSIGSVSAFPGRWQNIEDDDSYIELFKDGTGTVKKLGITWKVENGRFHILHPFYTFSAYYNVTSSTLTLITDDDEVIKYRKK